MPGEGEGDGEVESIQVSLVALVFGGRGKVKAGTPWNHKVPRHSKDQPLVHKGAQGGWQVPCFFPSLLGNSQRALPPPVIVLIIGLYSTLPVPQASPCVHFTDGEGEISHVLNVAGIFYSG